MADVNVTGFGPNSQYYRGIDPNHQVKLENCLSDDEIGRLIQKENVFSLAVTETEKLRAICSHRFPTGQDALVDSGKNDGTVRCQICGHEFLPVEVGTDEQSIAAAVTEVKDILQTIKVLYLDMPKDVAREYFVVIALLDKIPELFKAACKDYLRHEKFMPYGMNSNNVQNIISIYNMITGGAGSDAYVRYDDFGRPIDPGYNQNSVFANGNPIYNPQMYGSPLGWQGVENGFVNGQAVGFGQNGGYGTGYGAMGTGSMAGGTGAYQYQAETTGYAYDPRTGRPMDPTWEFDPHTGQKISKEKQPEGNVTEVKQTFKA